MSFVSSHGRHAENKGCPFRPDHQKLRSVLGDRRTDAQLVTHYQLERGLARTLLATPQASRAKAYIDVYSQLFDSLPEHPQHNQNHGMRDRRIRSMKRQLHPYLAKDRSILEIGCGDAGVSTAIAPMTAKAYALDVTDHLVDRSMLPANCHLLLTEGTVIPLPDQSIDFAFSDQLMEHLHPDDAEAQVAEVYRVLKPGGSYLCITPNRVVGPNDVSCFFEYHATGLHLREYDSKMLSDLFQCAGFRSIRLYAAAYGYSVRVPRMALRTMERLLFALPERIRAIAARNQIIRVLAGLHVIVTK